MSEKSGSNAKGGSGNGIKIGLIVVLFAGAAYMVYANYGGGNKQPPSAAGILTDEERDQIIENQKKFEAENPGTIGGA